MNKNGSIGIFDSGVGGLKILSAVRKAYPKENIIYVFDRTHAPYGKKSERYVKLRAEKISSFLIKKGVKSIIVACNTATTVAIKHLRNKYNISFIGVEPPIKTACKENDGKILLLCTPLTCRQQSVKELIDKYDINDNIVCVPCPNLASDVEKNFSDLSALKNKINSLLLPYKSINPSAVVLGCTHYYYIKDLIHETLGNIKIYEATDGVTKRLGSILKKADLFSEDNIGLVKYIYL